VANPYRIQFVSSVNATPTVNLDLSNDLPWRTQPTSDLTPPALNRAVAGTLLADGQIVPAAAYANRLITLVLQMQGTLTDDQAATYLQGLFRQLNQATNVLLWQPGTTQPVFFRTFRADLSQVVFDPIQKLVTARIPAEPFAVGVVEALGTITVPDGSGNMYADLTGIKGDVETPLKLDFGPTGGSTVGSMQEVFAIRRSLSTIALQPLVDATTGTPAIADTTVTAGVMRTTFATSATHQLRFSVATNLGQNRDTRGRYRVFAKYKKSVSGDVITLQLNTNDIMTLPTGNAQSMVDLGYISVPTGGDPVTDGYSAADAPSASELTLSILEGRTSGSGNLDIYNLQVIPADDQFAIISRPAQTAIFSIKQIWDGPRRTFYVMRVSPAVIIGGTSAAIAGTAQLMVSPGMTNRLFLIGDVTPGHDISGGIFGGSSSASVILSYWPRYLFVKPVTT
jgi:hypothetical protein